MDDLSSLCTICHIEPPIYTCPRCTMQTCSLECSKRHKVRSMCNGIRDPTVFLPISEVATPWGLDHDYNFIHGIETRIQRSEKVLIEDLELVSKDELERARKGETIEEFNRRTGKRNNHEPPGEACIERLLNKECIRVIKAPKGMRRNKENTTCWNRKQRNIVWQVEWIREDNRRSLYRALGNKPIGDFYDAMCEEERKLNLTEEERREEKRVEKKRRADDHREQLAKKAKIESEAFDLTTVPLLQDPGTGAWNVIPLYTILDDITMAEAPSIPPPKTWNLNFYLHRPLTPASFPKVLVPISPTKTLIEQLHKRDVLEFPTIHVLPSTTESLPDGYMLEDEFLRKIGNKSKGETDTEMSDSDDTSSDDSSSSEDSDSDESVEDGEIV
ncbi:hypothetical protein ONS95_005439 [Cadophora gregata]|uniref:uncharacterized protein n=1 Tax=Cadophora gregata TaxID=51156 RepID=UPI0026DDB80E|nr:uncharacterized protein ONS95_005439 [Cadophora gregata]KAK0103415.1 hypothetical protein ONS95_005439 [Cadophora gregata]KAK0107603.1 hypothetical protein ONS96_003409 [Cadophora gregata f. sp. sojae]